MFVGARVMSLQEAIDHLESIGIGSARSGNPTTAALRTVVDAARTILPPAEGAREVDEALKAAIKNAIYASLEAHDDSEKDAVYPLDSQDGAEDDRRKLTGIFGQFCLDDVSSAVLEAIKRVTLQRILGWFR